MTWFTREEMEIEPDTQLTTLPVPPDQDVRMGSLPMQGPTEEQKEIVALVVLGSLFAIIVAFVLYKVWNFSFPKAKSTFWFMLKFVPAYAMCSLAEAKVIAYWLYLKRAMETLVGTLMWALMVTVCPKGPVFMCGSQPGPSFSYDATDGGGD